MVQPRPSRLARLFAPAKRLGVVALVFDAGTSCVLLGLQFRAIELRAAPITLGLLGAMPGVTAMAAVLLAGRASDRLGRRLAEVAAFICCIASWLLMAGATTTDQLLWLAALTGVGLGFAWAPLAAWMGDLSGGSRRLLNRYLGYYNLGWSSGLMVGPLLAGGLWDHSHDLVFILPVGLTLGCLGIVLTTPHGQRSELPPAEAAGAPRDVVWFFLAIAWLGGFAACFGRATIGAIFPRLGHDLGFSALTIGQVTFASAGGETLAFLGTRLTSRWRHRFSVQAVTMALGGGAMLLAAWTSSPWVFAGCFAVMGAALAVTYAAAIQGALQASDTPGRLAGYTEAWFTAGLVLGPYLGGVAAQHWNLRTPLTLSATVCGAALLAQVGWWLRYRLRRRTLPTPRPR